ncbi:MAG: RIP metalloprotease RseP [Chthoniobacteraceae bacterium]
MFFTALKTVIIILEVLLIFNLMIIVHELGHFLAARWRGLVIEKFGIWFGKPLWKKTINGVEYSLGSIPAGGFVALPQLAPMEVMEGKVETPREQLPPISALDKIIVAFAGPLFSFGLAFVFALIVWQAGRPVGEAESTTVVGYVAEKQPAAEAGLRPGDKLLSIDGHKVSRFGGMGADSITWRIVRSEGDTIAIDFERDGAAQTVFAKPRVPEKHNWWNRKGLRQIGIGPAVSAVLADVATGSAAEAAGLKKGDIITAVNGHKLFSPDDIYDAANATPAEPLRLAVDRNGQAVEVQLVPTGVRVLEVPRPSFLARLFGATADSPAAKAGLEKGDIILSADGKPTTVNSLIDYISTKAGTPVALHVRRAGRELDLQATPQEATISETGEKRALIGFTPGTGDGMGFLPMGKYRVVHPGPLEQLRAGVMSIVNTLDAVLSRKSGISVQHMGGPVMMMNAYYTMLSSPEGLRMALWFSVVLNVNLALLNMLPIPVLDGGHITLAIVEAIRRKPVNVKFLEFVQTGCALMIIGFMVFIAFFDVQDLPFVGGKSSGVKFQKAPASEIAK